MKKLILSITAAISLLMLTGCVVVTNEPVVVVSPTYDITCYNNTNRNITDWCVKRNDHYTYANSDYNCYIPSGECDIIEDLPPGDDQILFTFKSRGKLHDYDYEATGTFYLDEDVTFYVQQRNIYGRSALTNNKADEEPQYVLVCSNGMEYELTSCTQNS